MANARVQPSNLAPRLLTSLRMQAIEYRRRAMLLLLVIALPVAFWAATYYSTGSDLVPVKVPERTRTVELAVPLRETFPVDIGLMGVAWSVAAASFFSVTGSLERDRRLVLCGYGAWQILLARLGLLACVSVVLAFAATLIFAVLTFSLHPELTWLAAFLAGLIAAGTGMFLGTLLPRPTEGMLIIIGLFGIGMSLGEEASRYFFMYPTQQLLRAGRFARDPWPVPHIWQGLLIAGVFVGLALILWSWRTRVFRLNLG